LSGAKAQRRKEKSFAPLRFCVKSSFVAVFQADLSWSEKGKQKRQKRAKEAKAW
jgi:hypothetical protein